MFEIRSLQYGTTLQLLVYPAEARETFWAEIRSRELTAKTRVYAYTPAGNDFGGFFAALAERWRGWAGELTWRSLEGEMSFVATHDGVGHIELIVTLASGAPPIWKTQVALTAAAGELDDLAQQASRLAAAVSTRA